MRTRTLILSTCFFLLLSFKLKAQINASAIGFEADIIQGCAPLVVQFTDTSNATNISYRAWNFGNGNTAVGNNGSVGATYVNSGFYTVTLTVSNGLDTVTITRTNYIEVFEGPNATFSYSPTGTGCAPHHIQFTNNTTQGSAAILGSTWSFGDASPPLNQTSPSHTYSYGGAYYPTITVVDQNGCVDSYTHPVPIVVRDKPVADFTASPSNVACAPPLTTTLSNTSTGTGSLSSHWIIGGNITYQNAPTVTMNQSGSQDVTLIVSDAYGCSDTLFRPGYISVGTIQADFTYPSTICVGSSVQFLDNSIGGYNHSWNFGNGATSSQQDPYTVYNATGTYTVSLSISDPTGQCVSNIQHTVTVVGVQAQFTASPVTACETPHTVNFQDQSTGTGTTIADYWWDFGEMFSTTTGQGNPSYTYSYEDTYDVTLVVTSPEGCQDTLVQPGLVVIDEPNLAMEIIDSKGCIPRTIDFNDLTSSVWPIASYSWDFGNGQTATGPSVSATYTQPGDYVVELEVITTNGCTLTLDSIVRGGTHQQPAFSLSDSINCAYDSLYFTNLSTDSALIEKYQWFFGDGGSSQDYEPFHQYNDTGYMQIILITDYKGCKDTLVVDSAYYAKGAVVNFSPIVNCDSLWLVDFSSNMIMCDTFWWDFGDSSGLNTVDTFPEHNFPGWGNYVVTLWGKNDSTGCHYEKKQAISLRDPEAIIQFEDSTICREHWVDFSGDSSIDASSYAWDYGFPYAPGTTAWSEDEFGAFETPSPGNYTMRLIVYDINGCPDTTYLDYYISKPNAQFSANPTIGCGPNMQVQYVDQSQSDTTITHWKWDYLPAPYTNQQNPNYVYQSAMPWVTTYDSRLIVTDTFGCKDTNYIPDYIKVHQPHVQFYVYPNQVCLGDSIKFSIYSFDGVNYDYEINYDNGVAIPKNSQTWYYTYNQSGTYYPTVTIYDSLGCDSSFTLSIPITVHEPPMVNFGASLTDTTCYPAQVIFYDSVTSSSPAVSYQWFFGDSSNVVTLPGDAYYTYSLPGYYDVKLIVTDSVGCVDSLTQTAYIHIGGPLVEIQMQTLLGCVGDPMVFTVDNDQGVGEFTWDFGDGFVQTYQSGSGTSFDHTYQQTGIHNVILLYESVNGDCVASDSATVDISTVFAGITVSDTSGCEPYNFVAYADNDSSDLHHWYLGGTVFGAANDTSLDYTFNQDGYYTVAMVAENTVYGCVDTASQEVFVYPKPDPVITPRQTICLGDSIILIAGGGIYYQWSSFAAFDSITPNSIQTWPIDTVDYKVVVINQYGCVDSTETTIDVQFPPNITWFPTDTMLFVGQSFEAFYDADQTLNFWWEPAQDMDCSGCFSPIIYPPVTQEYTLYYSDLNSCFSFDTTFTITVEDKYNITIPNAFTPNGDGLNDYFNFKAYGVKAVKEFLIFNRWGEVVFESSALGPGWDGTYKGELQGPNQMFYYKLTLERFNGEEYDFEGRLFLINK
tara:strand:+ start:2940 stop:7331 length:4392 start_codon:yes stop_codon:yes gene_type:complete